MTISRRRVNRSFGILAAGALATGRLAATPGERVPTPKQGEGPFYPVNEQLDKDLDLVWVKGRDEPAAGEVILVGGQVLKPDGTPLANALVDVWQANHYGRYDHPDDENPAPLDPNFQSWGMIRTGGDGEYSLKTIMPGAYPLSQRNASRMRPRHIHFKVSHEAARSLTTQMYFKGDPLIEQDDLFQEAPEHLRHLLVAESKQDRASGLERYQFDIVLASA